MQSSNLKSKNVKNAGITLVELTVVLAIFMVIVGVMVGIFISVVHQQRTILKEQELLNQTSYLTDYLSRTIRMSRKGVSGNCLADGGVLHPGYIFLLTHYDSVSGFYQGLKLLTNNGVCQEIFLDDNGILKEIKDDGEAQNMLSSTFVVAYARFIINGDKALVGATQNDLVQPRVTFVFNVQTQENDVKKDHIIQSTVSQINLNVSQ